ncbi:MAG: hypothetical protein RLZ75_1621 [Pseudomonadota bacterium]|jgi:hypothetical protein
MTFTSFLMGIAGSLAARVLLSLGFGIFSYAALNTLATTVVNNVTTNYNQIDITVLNLINLAGGGDALGIVLGALVTRASLVAFKRLRPV